MKKVLSIALALIMMLAIVPMSAISVSAAEADGWYQQGNQWYIIENGSRVINQWREDSTGWLYLGDDGLTVVGMQYIDDYTYYFDENGYMQTGWLQFDNDWMYFYPGGQLATDTLVYDSVGLCCVDGSGRLAINSVMYIDYDNDGYWERYYTDSNGHILTGWKELGDGRRYFCDVNGTVPSGWYNTPDGPYYFYEGFVEADQYYYASGDYIIKQFVDEQGRPKANQWIDEGYDYDADGDGIADTHEPIWYHTDANGRSVIGWQFIDGSWFYFNRNSTMVTGTYYIAGERYSFDENSGRMQTGWVDEIETYWTSDGQEERVEWYFYGDDGKAVSGWQQIWGSWYYFYTDGQMATGVTDIYEDDRYWYESSYDTYVFDENSGRMMTGWAGVTQTRWDSVQGKNVEYTAWYYCDASGRALKRQWISSGGYWYHFDSDGEMVFNRPVSINISEDVDEVYVFDNEGRMQTGWASYTTTEYVGNDEYEYVTNWYYCGSDGKALCDEWMFYNGSWYRFYSSGRMVTGYYTYVEEDDTYYGYYDEVPERDYTYYVFDDEGRMLTNTWCVTNSDEYWNGEAYEIENYWGYAQANGELLTEEWFFYNGAWYYFDYDGEMCFDGEYTIDDKEFRFDADGKMIVGWFTYDDEPDEDSDWCYYTHDGKADGWWFIDGYWYYFGATDGYWNYSSGYLQTGRQFIDGKYYSFAADGKMQTGWVEYFAEVWDSEMHDYVLQSAGWYHYEANGSASVGWKWINDKCYYFYADGFMATGSVLDNGQVYYFDAEGAWIY